jgi:hypothetical protein
MPLAIFAGIKGHPEGAVFFSFRNKFCGVLVSSSHNRTVFSCLVAAGFAQLCHGGLEIDSQTIDSFQRLLSSPEDPSRCCVSSHSSSRCNLQWGDFSGVAIHGGVASSSRGYTHDIEGTKAAIAKLGVRCVFRGHQVRIPASVLILCTFPPGCLIPVCLPRTICTPQRTSWKHSRSPCVWCLWSCLRCV